MNTLQRENIIIKESFEKEKAARQTLQLQLESKNQFIHSFTSPGNGKRSGSPAKSKSNKSHVNIVYIIKLNRLEN